MGKKLPMNRVIEELQEFATKHKVIFEDEGECGFGRECVGISGGDFWIAHNPTSDHEGKLFEPIEGFKDERLYPPEGVDDAYHKHDCLAVLGRGNKAIRQLHTWIKHIESLGEVEIVEYETGATGIQALVSGVFSKAIRIKP